MAASTSNSSTAPSTTEPFLYGFGKTTDAAFFPVLKSTSSDAVYIVRSAREYVIPAFDRGTIFTDLWLYISTGTRGVITACDGWRYNTSLNVVTRVIHAERTTNLGVLVYNLTNHPLRIPRG